MQNHFSRMVRVSWFSVAIKGVWASVVTTIFYKLLFDSKRDWECYASPHSHIAFGSSGKVNVSENFEFLFMIGLASGVAACLMTLLNILALVVKSQGVMDVSSCFDSLNAVLGFAWLLVATYWRFRHEGQVCSGKYQDLSGREAPYLYVEAQFLKIYIVMCWVFPLFFCLCGACLVGIFG